jgi:ubiquinone/menaquinone biosynthesis C-methylase UbiE
MSSAEEYFSSRLREDKKRKTLWSVLASHISKKYIQPDYAVVELGAGWCDFINNIDSHRRLAVDVWEGLKDQAGPGVECLVHDATVLPTIENGTIDVIFASNFVEHLTQEEFRKGLEEWHRVLKPGGRLILVQPNFRYAFKRYFDDYTHISIWTHTSLVDFVCSKNWTLEKTIPKFMPLSIKTKLPVSKFLIKSYLLSPVKPFAGQMMMVFNRI